MAYYRHIYQKNHKKIPVPIAVLSIVVLVFMLVGIFKRDASPIKRKLNLSNTSILNDSQVANVRDNSLVIYWETKTATKGYIRYGESPESMIYNAYDYRDTTKNQTPRKIHAVQLTQLKPSTQYSYSIVIDGKEIGQSSQDPFVVSTTRIVTKPTEFDPLYGTVQSIQNVKLASALVVLKIDNAVPLVAVTKQDGSFLISSCCIFNTSTLEPIYPSKDQNASLEFRSEDGATKIVNGKLHQLVNYAEPYVLDNSELTLNDATNQELAKSEFLLTADKNVVFDSVDIIYPREDSAIPASKPLLKGVASPDSSVIGKIMPGGKNFQVTTDGDGVWTYLPSELDPGKHVLEVQTQDALGKTLALSRSFTILKSGEAVLGDATESGNLSPTPEATGSAGLTPTSIPTEIPTAEPTVIIETTPEPPVSGTSILPFTLFSIALVVLGAGLILIF